MTSEVSPSSDVEKDIGTIECIGRCLGGAFERDLLTHAKLIRAHIVALEAENKRLRDLLECWDGVATSHEPTGHQKDCGCLRCETQEALAQTDEPAKS